MRRKHRFLFEFWSRNLLKTRMNKMIRLNNSNSSDNDKLGYCILLGVLRKRGCKSDSSVIKWRLICIISTIQMIASPFFAKRLFLKISSTVKCSLSDLQWINSLSRFIGSPIKDVNTRDIITDKTCYGSSSQNASHHFVWEVSDV